MAATALKFAKDLSAHLRHVSGTIFKKTAVFQAFGTPSKAKWRTEVSHTAQAKSELTLGNRWARDDLDCRTEVYHRRVLGVWRRGAVYQFRMRVPKDVRETIGRSHLSRSLKTDSLTVANRLAAQCALEAAASFNRARHTPRVPDVPLREVAREAVRGRHEPMSAANVNEHMNKPSTVLNWAMREDLCSSNPARGLRLPSVRSAKDRRKAFSADQLCRIFNAPVYRGCVDDERHYAVEEDQRPKRSRFWVPLFSLFGGLRLNEACQLLVDDKHPHLSHSSVQHRRP